MLYHELNIQPSKQYKLLLILTLIAGLAVLGAMPWWLSLKSAAMLIFSGYLSTLFFNEACLQHRDAVISLNGREPGLFDLKTREGKVYHAKLSGDSVVTSVVAVLRFPQPETRQFLTVILFRDSFSQNGYQQLMRMIKLG